MNYISIVFFVNDKYSYANSKNNKLDKYYKNMINLYQLAKINKLKNNTSLILFSNNEIPNKFKKRFDELNVEIIIRDNNHIPPSGYSNMWEGTFFYLDAIEYFSKVLEKEDILIMIDPDCIISRDLTPVLDIINLKEVVMYKLDYPFEYCQNGLSRKEMKNIIMEEINKDVNPSFFGGEFYGFKGNVIKNISESLEEAWEMSLNRFYNNKTYFKTEEHIFTYIFYKLSYESGNANRFIKRIWTAPSYSNVERDDLDYIIWHLPAEKDRGLIKIYNKFFSHNSKLKNLDNKDLSIVLGNVIGIPNKGYERYLLDSIHIIAKKILKK